MANSNAPTGLGQPAGFDARVLTVLIASPGDTAEARDAVEQAVLRWNRDRARSEKIVLMPVRWETDAVPEMGADGQSVINDQLVDLADVVVALFHSRLGSPTPRDKSGTAEEIRRAHELGLPVHVYFSTEPHATGVDAVELQRLRDFRERTESKGLVGEFTSRSDLTEKVRTALEHDVRALAPPATGRPPGEPEPARPQAQLRAQFDRESDRLIVENTGSGPADDVHVEIEAVHDGRAPDLLAYTPIERLLPNADYRFLVSVTSGVAMHWRIKMRWNEAGETFEEFQSLSVS